MVIGGWTEVSSSTDKKFMKKGEKLMHYNYSIYNAALDLYDYAITLDVLEGIKKIISQYEIGSSEYNINFYNFSSYWLDMMSSNGYKYNKQDDLIMSEYLAGGNIVSNALNQPIIWNQNSIVEEIRKMAGEGVSNMIFYQTAIMELLGQKGINIAFTGSDIDPDIRYNYENSLDLVKRLALEFNTNHGKKTRINNIYDILHYYSDDIKISQTKYIAANTKSILLLLSELRINAPKNEHFYKVKANIVNAEYYSKLLKQAGLKKIRNSNSGLYRLRDRDILIALAYGVMDYDIFKEPYPSHHYSSSEFIKTNTFDLELLIARLILIDYLDFYINSYFYRNMYIYNQDSGINILYYLMHDVVSYNIQRYVSALGKREVISLLEELNLQIAI